MRNELEKQLVKDFPLCFGDVNKPLTQSLMGFGCECNDGWYQIIHDACQKAEPLIKKWLKDNPNADRDWMPRFSQIKEKFGGLRLYFTTYPPGFDKIERDAEKKSITTCETCGTPGKIRGQGWYYCSCNVCAKPEDRDNLEYLENEYDKKHKKNKRIK
jgi:hypothetical protein